MKIVFPAAFPISSNPFFNHQKSSFVSLSAIRDTHDTIRTQQDIAIIQNSKIRTKAIFPPDMVFLSPRAQSKAPNHTINNKLKCPRLPPQNGEYLCLEDARKSKRLLLGHKLRIVLRALSYARNLPQPNEAGESGN